MKTQKGFTLVEVLLVVVIISILAAVVIVAINPGRQIAQTNNAQRSAEIKSIIDAVHEFSIDNRGALPGTADDIEAAAKVVGSDGGAAGTQADICTDLVPTYLAEMPFDPTSVDAASSDAPAHYTSCVDYYTGYTIAVDADGRITVAAPDAELSEVLSVTR